MERTASFGYWLRRRRKALDLTQEALAQQVGCAAITIRKIEADELRPSSQVAARLATCLRLEDAERVAFLKTARADVAVDQLPLATAPVASAATPAALPTGTITLLFTDIEGSTRLWEEHPDAMRGALARHDALLRDAVGACGGVVFKAVGDGIHAVFAYAASALTAALQAQRALETEPWGSTGPIRVRMALHTGVAEVRDEDYFGPTLNRIARLLAAGHGGQILLSNATVELVRDTLPPDVTLRDLGQHRLKDLTRTEHIFQVLAPDLPAALAPLNTLAAHLNNLPAQPNALIGREHEIALVRELLRRTDVRLVTLTGPGGTGKTRLALQVATELLDDFSHGTWFINLAPISDPALLVLTIAQVLGVTEAGSQPLSQSLKEYVRDKQLLLLLDNFEQMLEAAPQVAELLASAAGLKLLVTSRAALRLSGEREFAVPPLVFPDPDRVPALDRLLQYEAVRLFLDRAQAVRVDFVMHAEDAPAVAEICQRLDGLPLAIELAAARIKLFSPPALLARLQRPLKILTRGARDLPARQQTLRSTIDWSYRLLSTEEQLLFHRLGIFVGGCTLEAVEAVCNADGDLSSEAVDGVAALVDQSLARQIDGMDGVPRFTMLETIREYAQERMVEQGEQEMLRSRHAAYYLTFVEQAEPNLRGQQQAAWLVRLEAEHDNLRAALAWSLEEPTDLGVRLAGALWWFWFYQGHFGEGLRWLEQVLAHTATMGITAPRAKAFIGAAMLACYRGVLAQAQVLCETGLAMARSVEDNTGTTLALNILGTIARSQRNYAVAYQLYEESLAHARAIHHTWLTALALGNLGIIAFHQDDYQQALAYCAESVALFRTVDDTWFIAGMLNILGRVTHSTGDNRRADELHRESLALFRDRGNRWGIALCVGGLAAVAGAQGQTERAARLLGAEEALRETIGEPLFPTIRADHERMVAIVRAALSADVFVTAWATGRAMTPEQALAYALEE